MVACLSSGHVVQSLYTKESKFENVLIKVSNLTVIPLYQFCINFLYSIARVQSYVAQALAMLDAKLHTGTATKCEA